MSDQNTVLFGMSAGQKSTLEASYPFNKIMSSDNSISVGDFNGHTDLTVSIEANGSVSSIFEFMLDENLTHYLYCKAQGDGLVSVGNGSLSLLTLPIGPSILVGSGSGPFWLPIPSGIETWILGVSGGSFEWFGMSDCANACEEETQE